MSTEESIQASRQTEIHKAKWAYRRSIQAASPQRHTQSRTRPPQTQTLRIGATSLPLQIGEQGR